MHSRLITTGLALLAAANAQYSSYGCFKASLVSLTYQDNYQFQSSGHCQLACAGKGVVGLMGGNKCYCGDTVPNSSDQVDSSNCNTECQGWPYEFCGGSNYYILYVDSSANVKTEGGDSSSSTAPTTTKTSSTPTTTTSSSSTSTPTITSSSPSTSSTATETETDASKTNNDSTSSSSSTSTSSSSSSSSSSSLESSGSQRVEVLTVTSTPSGTMSASIISVTTTKSGDSNSSSTGSASTNNNNNSNNNNNKSSSGSKKLSGGAIAGIVIGSIVGVLAIIGLFLFFCWYRKRDEDDNDDEFTLSGPANEEKHPYNINNNPFVTAAAAVGAGGAGAGAAAGRAGGTAYSGGTFTRGENSHHLDSFSSLHDNDDLLFVEPAHDITGEGNKYSSDFGGRRRLSNGSLPDMVTRNPGSLKVVNN